MYIIKRVTEEYNSQYNLNVEKFKSVSMRKTKAEAIKQKEILEGEYLTDKEKYDQIYDKLLNEFNGDMNKLEDDERKYLDKFRANGLDNYLRHEIETVGKWI